MAAGKQLILSVLAVCAVTASVYADMMPASLADSAYQPLGTYDRTGIPGAGDIHPNGLPALASPLGPIAFLPRVNANATSADWTQTQQVLTDDRGSFDLCLYALFGLGLCRSVPLIRKLSLGGMPDWYHHGGPFQIGHSHEIAPDCLLSAAACFVQPDCTTEDVIPHCYQGSIAALLRKSLFTPGALASRGPPLTC